MRLTRFSKTLLLIMGCFVWLEAKEQPAFRGGVELVRAAIAVTGRTAIPVSFGPDDLVLMEDGVRQRITYVERDRRPVSVCLLLDISNSMTPGHRSLAHRVIEDIVGGLSQGSEVAVLSFAGSVQHILNWTTVPPVPQLDLNRLQAADDTSLFDAVEKAMEHLEAANGTRTIVAIATDGGETTSKRTLAQIVTTRRQSESLVYSFHIAPWARPSIPSLEESGSASRQRLARLAAAAENMAFSNSRQLAGESGGAVYTIRVNDDAKQMALEFLGDLDRQFLIGYNPVKPFDGSYRRLQIRSNRPDIQIRHRSGYLAVPQVEVAQ